MLGNCAIATGAPTQFLSGTRLSFQGSSRSSGAACGSMSFTGAGSSTYSYRISVEAFAETTTGSSSSNSSGRSSSRRRMEAMKPMARNNLYEVLQVKQTASPVEIKSAYRSLAKLYHPDAATSGDSAVNDFIEIHNAYATLSDPTARERYDLSIGARRHFSLSSSAAAAGGDDIRSGFVVGRTRRWETDQCW